MTITKYDYDLGRLVYPGATLPSPCPHGWTERCPHCMGGEINRLRAELPQSPPEPISFMQAMDIIERGFVTWKSKPHNKKWFKLIDGTPIPNDLAVNIAEAFCSAHTRPLCGGK